MRANKTNAVMTVNAIAGTHVVVLGLDLKAAARKGCLGFAIQREDQTEGETTWMKGMKTFQSVLPHLGPGGQVSSREHPIQSFQWSDYSAKPNHKYVYNIVPIYGPVSATKEGPQLSVTVTTEGEFDQSHSIFFNRGSIATQEYTRRFQDKPPSELEGTEQIAAYAWLSRGLLEAFEEFVGRAKNGKFELYGAFYEFQWPAALAALKQASERGAKVKIVYDNIPGKTGPGKKNTAAIAKAKIKALCTPFARGRIMHNKFLVLVDNGKPVAVWTGSTNLTENGIFGHSNCAHVVEEEEVAQTYLNYWKHLKGNVPLADERKWVAADNPLGPIPPMVGDEVVFSPRTGLAPLDRYAEIAGAAKQALFMSFAFGMDKRFQSVYDSNDATVLRIALMEKEGNGAALKAARITIGRIRRRPNVIVAIGNNIVTNSFDHWLAELSRLSSTDNVHWVHTKYMLVDPLGKDPVVVTGSANFSEASTNANNENMLVIRGNSRVADIYVGEFMRLYAHYAFRESVKIAREKGETEFHPNYLIEDDSWQDDYFKPGSQRMMRRTYFAGTKA